MRRPPRSRRGAPGTTRGQTPGPLARLPPAAECFGESTSPRLPAYPARPRRRASRASLTRRLPPSVGTHAGRTGARAEPECAGRAEAGRINGKRLRGPAVPVLTKRPGGTVTVDTLPSGPRSFLRGAHGPPMPIGRPDSSSRRGRRVKEQRRPGAWAHTRRRAAAPARRAGRRLCGNAPARVG